MEADPLLLAHERKIVNFNIDPHSMKIYIAP